MSVVDNAKGHVKQLVDKVAEKVVDNREQRLANSGGHHRLPAR